MKERSHRLDAHREHEVERHRNYCLGLSSEARQKIEPESAAIPELISLTSGLNYESAAIEPQPNKSMKSEAP